MMKKIVIAVFAILMVGCSSYQISDSPKFQGGQRWAIMPMINHSNTPLASERAEQILHSLLFAEGVKVIQYPAIKFDDLASILDDSSKQKHAEKWLESQQVKYIISGSIEEWQYKSGLDGEPAVGISLLIRDKKTKKTIWRASGSRAGWGRESLSGTGQIVIQEMLDDLELDD